MEVDYCPRCRGIWFDARELAELLAIGNLDAFTRESPLLRDDSSSVLSCPRHHHSPMHERTLASPRGAVRPIRIDQCTGCEGLWLDGDELNQVSRALLAAEVQPFLASPDRPTGLAVWLFMLLTGLPVEGWNPRRRRPIATGVLIALCVAGFAWQLIMGLEASILGHGLVPVRIAPGPLLSHMFLHGDLLHLLGNLYFLWVFGDNVEDRLGRPAFLLLFLLSGLAAALLHCGLTDDPHVPVVGASGAISGVMAAYAVLFPRARLVSLIIVFQVRWNAVTYLLLWLALQLVGASLHVPGIAWWAHVGGFLAGGAIAWRLRGSADR